MIFSRVELDPGETIVHEVRKHWIVFAWRAIWAFAVAVIPLIVYPLTVDVVPEKLAELITWFDPILLFAYAMWLLAVWTILFIRWTNYYLDVWFITNERIIDVDQKGIFHREISNLRFDRIQDVTVEVKGVYATFLKYGDLRVQTAAEDSTDYTMPDANQPEEARRVIFELHNKKKTIPHDVDGVH